MKWTTIPTPQLLKPRANCAAYERDGQIWIFGGRYQSEVLNDLFMFEISTGLIQTLNSNKLLRDSKMAVNFYYRSTSWTKKSCWSCHVWQ